MNKKLLVYSLVGIFTGSVATAFVMVSVSKINPQATLLIPSVQAQTSSPPKTVSPMMRGMMNEQHFIVMMIPHHEGAIAMADLALNRATHPEIKELAKAIKSTQSQEIQQMQNWYKDWYSADVPRWVPGMGMHGWNGNRLSSPQGNWTPSMGMSNQWGANRQSTAQSGWQSGMGCMGMRTMAGNITALQNVSDFDRAFIEEMIPHHQMGVMMAQMVLASSNRTEIAQLAKTIIDTQTAEINQMQQWYQQWYQ